LTDIHRALGAKMIPFAGYEMPVYYAGIVAEHKCVRDAVGMFDVSHMGEVFVTGPKALEFVQSITVNDAAALVDGQAQYSAMCRTNGGIVDDLLVYKLADERYMLVINASNIEKDYGWMEENAIDGATLENRSDDYTLLAVQGPRAIDTLASLTDVDLSAIEFYHFTEGTLAGVPMIISRTGYTGELGFELYLPSDEATSTAVWNAIMAAGRAHGIEPIGLGARDTLRMEMGYCLYGNDITEETNPIEAGLGWITKLDKGTFNGSDVIARVKEEKPARKLIAFTLGERGIPRHGYPIMVDGETVGEVTSGTMSPTLNAGIGMGYVASAHAKPGTAIAIVIRDKQIPATIRKAPLIEKK
jgi:aminomethyltransferase